MIPEQLTPDFCIPKKIRDCPNIFPEDCCKIVVCPEGQEMCLGGYDDAECKIADKCIPKGSVCDLIGFSSHAADFIAFCMVKNMFNSGLLTFFKSAKDKSS